MQVNRVFLGDHNYLYVAYDYPRQDEVETSIEFLSIYNLADTIDWLNKNGFK